MDDSLINTLEIQPEMIRLEYEGWQAISPKTAVFHIGVTASAA